MRTEGWLRAIPEKDGEGTILRWFVALTNAIREERPDPLARGGMEQSGSGLFKPNPGTTSRDPAPTRGRDLAPPHAPGHPSADVEITFEEWAAENDI
jgi:hypothetical protein